MDELAEAMASGIADPAITVGKFDRRRALTEPAFIGRRAELARANEWWLEARSGNGGLVLLESESGGGKTRLLEELARNYLGTECAVFWDRAWTRQRRGRFKCSKNSRSRWSATAALHPEAVDIIRRRLGEQMDAALTALPELKAVLEPTRDGVLGPEDFGEIRNLQALTAFRRLGHRRPTCVDPS